MAGQRLRYGAAVFAIVLATFFAFIVPLVGRATIDGAIGQSADHAAEQTAHDESSTNIITDALGGGEHLASHLWIAALVMLGLTALSGTFTYFKGRWSAMACENICRNLRDRLYDHLQHLPSRYHDKADTGDLVQRCTSDVETLRLFLAVQIVEIGNAMIILAICIPIMLMLDVSMTLVSFTFIPLILLFAIVFFVKVKNRFRDVDEAEARMTTVLQENLTGIRVVRAFARQAYERDKFAGPNGDYRNRAFRLIYLLAWYWTISDVFCLTQMALSLGIGAYWVSTGDLSIGTLYAFLVYVHMMLWPVRQMGRILTDMGKAVVALGRMEEILDQAEEQNVPANSDHANTPTLAPAPAPAPFIGDITFRDITFGYDESAPVVSDINIEVKAGQTLALLGPSGSGKTTLVQLLLRLYDIEQGRIELDGKDLATLPRKHVRSQIGVVLQEPFLFSASLGDNIRRGHTQARDREITAAAEAACIHETISSMQSGYETVIGERGVNLSGGQRQRIAIARALVRDPAILILDDALSAVDSQTESMILDAIRKRHGKKTTLVIAHRLSSLIHADQIVVLERGHITQQGKHKDLINQPGLYQRLWQVQTNTDSDTDLNTGLDMEQQSPTS
jgi:ATP-binding cassette, subfamily B, bacterial